MQAESQRQTGTASVSTDWAKLERQLMRAIRRGDAVVACDILTRNPAIDINNATTALLHEAGSAAVVRLLLSPPRPHRPYSDVNRDWLGRTPLSSACMYGRKEVVRELLGVVGVDPNKGNPLLEASSVGQAGVVALLLGHPRTDVNNTSHCRVVHCGLDSGAPPATTPLTAALLCGHMEVARMILAHGGRVDEKSQAEVDEAMGGHNKYLQWLLQCAHQQVRLPFFFDLKPIPPPVSSLTSQIEMLKAELGHWKEENLNLQARVQSLTDEIQKEKKMVKQMIALIPADISDFTLVKLLGTGASAAAFQVLCLNTPTVGTTSAAATSTITRSSMVMKVMFNWENTPRHTMIRQKYMSECVILSSIPPHPNVIHPLGALVIPRLPDEFIEQIPASQAIFREMALHKSLAFIMPFGGIPLSSFLQSLHSPSSSHGAPWDVTVNLFQQALMAVSHIETNKFIHRDIKEDNVLVDPDKTLSLIDFGEAIQCLKPDLEEIKFAEIYLIVHLDFKATGPTLFSYSKCDSFALAVTFWDALLPPQHKFIGSTLNNNMATFTPEKLAASFPDPLSFFPRAADSAQSSGLMKDVMIAMMETDKQTRMSCLDALECLSGVQPAQPLNKRLRL
ncbi:hypothetical protein Pelo_15815 [Pelomyxa schiedti]|nr:hypothetical protein Pelo_15815 [Pelomyxa schiedti]